MPDLNPPLARPGARRPAAPDARPATTSTIPVGRVGAADDVTVTVTATGSPAVADLMNALTRAGRIAAKGVAADLSFPDFLLLLEGLAEAARLEKASKDAKERVSRMLDSPKAGRPADSVAAAPGGPPVETRGAGDHPPASTHEASR